VRLLHATDVHWFAPPGWGDVSVKRVFGTANLYLRGRRRSYDPAVQRELVAHLLAERPDAVLISGDLTAQALDEEFRLAREALDPLLRSVPTLVIPGNHDVYAPDAKGRLRRWFGPWCGGDGPVARLDVGPLTLLGLDTNRPTWLTADGRVPQDQRDALRAALHDPGLRDRTVVLALHHPPVDRRGAPYVAWSHGLVDSPALAELLAGCPRRPDLVCCGHVHHGFRADWTLPDGSVVPVIDCGSSGHAHEPERGRAAACAAYTFGATGAGFGVERWLHDGARFVPEAGGAFASGR
jgi:3',5'-cyclic AMP phosphodiesterase CpdA